MLVRDIRQGRTVGCLTTVLTRQSNYFRYFTQPRSIVSSYEQVLTFEHLNSKRGQGFRQYEIQYYNTNSLFQTLSLSLSLSLSQNLFITSASTLAKAMIRFSSLPRKGREAFPQDGKMKPQLFLLLNDLRIQGYDYTAPFRKRVTVPKTPLPSNSHRKTNFSRASE